MNPCQTPCGDLDCLNNCKHYTKGNNMKTNEKLTVNFKDLDLSITKSKKEWIDELTEYTLNLAYQDGEFANGILDDFLRGGFKGFLNMTDSELIDEIIEQLEFKYDMENEA